MTVNLVNICHCTQLLVMRTCVFTITCVFLVMRTIKIHSPSFQMFSMISLAVVVMPSITSP